MNDETVVHKYPLKRAVADGVLIELFKNRWNTLSGGKPIVVTANLFDEVTLAGLLEIWNEFVEWRTNAYPGLLEEKRQFQTKVNGNTVWVLEDGQAFTLLYPEDY